MTIWDIIIQEYLVQDDGISEIETNGGQSIFVRKNGKRIEVPNVFKSTEDYCKSIIDLVKKINPYFNENTMSLQYLEEGRLSLSNGGTARVHIVLPPASDFPQVTIAKKTVSLTTLEKIFSSGSMNLKMYNFIKAAIDCKLTLVLSGSTGAGKTTFVEAMTKLIPMDTRIGIVEDSPELKLIQPNVTYLHSKPWKPGMDPNDEVTLDWCTRQINRMRTDLLIIGESRGKEFSNFLVAANSGMEGSMTTLHANNPKMALKKMSQFVLEAQTIPVRVANENIANTIDCIIQLSKNLDGKYRCIAIEEISNTLGNDESATIATTPLATYNERTDNWNDPFLISDKLRKKFVEKGYNCQTFTKGEQVKTGLPTL